MEVGSLVLGALLFVALGFATAVFDHSRLLHRVSRRTEVAPEPAATAAAGASGSEPPG